MNDIDQKIFSLATMDNDLIDDINEHGSISVYIDACDRRDEKTINILINSGFSLSLSEKIMYNVECNEMGDRPFVRFSVSLSCLSSRAIFWGDKEEVEKHYRDYRCWKEFSFGIYHGCYEYDRWIGSLEDLAENNPECNAVLMCTLREPDKEVDTTLKIVMPNLNYFIHDGILVITVQDINAYYSKN